SFGIVRLASVNHRWRRVHPTLVDSAGHDTRRGRASLAASDALASRVAKAREAVERLRQIDPALRVSNSREAYPVRRPEELGKCRWSPQSRATRVRLPGRLCLGCPTLDDNLAGERQWQASEERPKHEIAGDGSPLVQVRGCSVAIRI